MEIEDSSALPPESWKAVENFAEKKPKVLISDGAPNFRKAYIKEYWARGIKTRTEHVANIHLQGDMNNNKMEAFNGELRQRERVIPSLKRADSPVIKRLQVFHNYVRSHMGLDGKTPAEAAGIKVEGENKWITIIQNAANEDRSE